MIQKLSTIVVIALGIYIAFSYFGNWSGDTNDSSTLNDEVSTQVFGTNTVAQMRRIQTALEIMLTETGTYPLVGEACQSASVLKDELVPYYIESIPNSGIQVAVSNDGYEYVLRAKLTSASAILLSRDQDGQILGCECNDPFFCLKEYTEDPEEFYEKYGEEF